MKTLKTFLEKHEACEDGFKFAKDLTLEQFLETCPRGDWILWLFVRTNPESLKELTLAKAHCANTVRHLMTDKRSLNAVDVALAFGKGLATRRELAVAFAAAAEAASASASVSAFASALAASASASAYAYAADHAEAAYAYAYAYAADHAEAAKKQNQKQTADICRKFLPIEIWNQSKF
jgi:hypothetical protein